MDHRKCLAAFKAALQSEGAVREAAEAKAAAYRQAAKQRRVDIAAIQAMLPTMRAKLRAKQDKELA